MMLYTVPKHFKKQNIFFCEVNYFLSDNFKTEKNKVVILTSDHLSTDTLFVPILEQQPTVLEKIIKKTQMYPDIQFVVLHNCLNVNYQYKNCEFIHHAPEWITNIVKGCWKNTLPVTNKNFDQKKIWICLNRNKRVHRYLTAMWLLGNDLEFHGHLTLTSNEILEHENFESWVYWWNYNERPEINDLTACFPVLEKGFEKIKNKTGYIVNEYNGENLELAENFKKFLRPCYENSFVEIVNETIWMPDPGGIVSEKFINSVYGYNLPIFVGVANTVKYLKDLGFDLFDDVIDHSYDSEISPTLRLVQALEKNKELLYNKDKAVTSWKHCKFRMNHNVELSRHLVDQAESEWIRTLSNI